MHVLIIEDETFVAMQMQTLLEDLGADSTEIAVSQAEAVHMAAEHRPDLITSDVQLIEGDGPSAVRDIRSRCGNIPVIYVTANPKMAHAADPQALVLPKPIRWLDLVMATTPYGLPSASA